MFSFRHHGAGVCEVRFAGHLLEEKQELDKHPVEAGGGQAAGLGHELPGRNLCIVSVGGQYTSSVSLTGGFYNAVITMINVLVC